MTSRSGWRYFATRLNGDGTETMLDPDLPISDVGVSDVLSGDDSLTARIEPAYGRLIGEDGLPVLREWGTAIYAESDGEIRSGCILVNSGIEGPSWELDCVGWTGYLRDMPYTGAGYHGIQVDPLDVVRTIWGHVQGQRYGNIGLEIANTLTGIKIGTELKQVEFDTVDGPVSFEAGPYKLNWYSNHDLAGDIDALAAEHSFDYKVRHFWKSDGTIGHVLDLGYPKIGRRREDLRFVYGVNIFEPPAINRDGELYASGAMVLGAGEGASMIKSIREPPSRPTGRLRRIAVVVDDTIKTKSAADSRADAENAWRARIDDVDTILVQNHSNAPLGAAQVGDEIRLEGRSDWGDFDMWVRILSISYEPDNGNLAEYSVARTDKLTN